LPSLRAFGGSAAGSAALAALFVAALAAARAAGWLEPLELLAHDAALNARPVATSPAAVAVVAIDDPTLEAWGWPVPDDRLAAIVEAALAAGAAGVAVDLYRDRPVPPGNEALTAAFAKPGVFGAMKFAAGGAAGVAPPPASLAAGRVGFVDLPVDDDGTLRRALLYADDGGEVRQGLGLAAALNALAAGGIRPAADPDNPAGMRLGAAAIAPLRPGSGPYQRADAGGFQMLLDFRRAPGEVPAIGAMALTEGTGQATSLAGRTVFVGIASEVVKDLVATPRSGDTVSGLVDGVYLHAWTADQLIRAARGAPAMTWLPPEWAEWAMIAAAGAAGLALAMAIGSAAALAALAIGFAVVTVGGGFALFVADVWVPFVPGAIAGLGAMAIAVGGRLAAERRAKAALMRLFAQQVSAPIAEELWQRREEFLARGLPRPAKLTATIAFMDLAGSTTIADTLEPDTFMAWVGRFLERMARAAIDQGGFVDKYTGDGLMIVFGAPVARSGRAEIAEDARAAARAAGAMASALAQFNAEEEAKGRPRARMRIGIHTGEVFAGCVGAADRAQYTVMGAPVAAAARLEGLKEGFDEPAAEGRECRVLMSEATAVLLDDRAGLTKAGAVTLRGFARPIDVFMLDVGAGLAREG
jgi:adenylate cyclase